MQLYSTMNRLVIGAVCLLLTLNGLQAATTVQVALPAGLSTVSPLANVTFNLSVQGCDSVQVWTVVAGVTNALGQLRPPYNVTFTAAPSGSNVVICQNCDYRSVTSTNTFTLFSSIRTFPRRIIR